MRCSCPVEPNAFLEMIFVNGYILTYLLYNLAKIRPYFFRGSVRLHTLHTLGYELNRFEDEEHYILNG